MSDLANSGSLAGVLTEFLSGYIRDKLENQLPAVVVSYDSASNRATLRPLLMIKSGDQKIARATIANIPVHRYGAGGFFIAQPVKAGDFGWIKSNDADISLIFQRNGGEDQANTERTHSFSDGVFFPESLSGWDLVDEDALCLQSLDGKTYITLKDGEITIESDKVTIKGNDKIEIEAPSIDIIGELQVTGGISMGGGAISMSADVAINGKLENNGKDVGSGHTHSGVQAGGDTTGAPT